MKTIFKYEILPDLNVINIPEDSQILSVQEQQNRIQMWVLVDAESKFIEREFEVFGTGHEIKNKKGIDRKYIATFQKFDGALVFHLFENLKTNQNEKL